MSQGSEFGRVARRGYDIVFKETWPFTVGGVLVGILGIVTFIWSRPWGVVGGLRNWADWLFHGLGLYAQEPFSALESTNSVLTGGLLWGAAAAAFLSGNFALRLPPRLELVKGVVGGALLGVGAALAGGCNVGGFYTALSALSLSGVAMMLGLMFGAWLGLKYLYWEMERFSSGGGAATAGGPSARVQAFIGWALLLGAFAASEWYAGQGLVFVGGLLLCGFGFGFILSRSRLCFARCFREPLMTGESDVTRAVILSLMIGVVGFAAIKWVGLRPEMAYVSANFGLGGLVGGVVFGFGMILAGGCGSGTAWRAAEGQVKLMVALVFFALSNSLAMAGIEASETVRSLIGVSVFIPEYLGYQLTLVGLGAMLVLWLAAVHWNEKTEKFVVNM